jgi:hypothetical protein
VGITIEALTDREGKEEKISWGKEQVLRYESFPANDGFQYSKLPPAGNAHTGVT